MTRRSLYHIFWVVIFISACSNFDESKKLNERITKNIPRDLKHLKNLTIFSKDQKALYEVEFVKEEVFESTDEVLINGYVGETAVDNQGRIYIVGQKPGTVGVYIFRPNGSFKTRIVKEGRGPGEFEAIGSVLIKNNKLYVFGPRLQKIGVFSIKDYTLIDDFKIRKNTSRDDSLLKLLRAGDLLAVNNDGTLLVNFRSNVAANKNRQVLLHKLTQKGEIASDKVLEFIRPPLYIPSTTQTSMGIRMARTMPFSQSYLIAVSDTDFIYSAKSNEFLIKVYDKNGTYQRAIYYPYKNRELNISDLNLDREQRDLISENREKVPKTWPVLHTLEIDDQNRLWVATITESDTTFQWWVLNEKGELLAQFERPGKRSERSVDVPPMIVIKNGYWYSREIDISAGINRIEKYKIIFKEK